MKRIYVFLLIQLNALQIVFSNTETISELTPILQDLNTVYKIDLNIFINWNKSESDLVNLELLNSCIVQVNLSSRTFQNFRILGTFTERTIVIVYIEKFPLDASLREFLPNLMWKLHELHIVFITKEEPSDWQEDLFSYSFGEGFINVLLIHLHNQTVSLYSYNPYPVIQVQRISHLTDYFNRKYQLRNLHNFPIRTIPFTIEPRILQYVNRKGQNVTAGYMHNAILEFTRHYNATLIFLEDLPDPLSFNYAFYLFQKKKIDFASYPKELKWNISGTVPLYLTRQYVTLPYARPIASYLYFTRPFKRALWLAVMGTVGYGTLVLYAIHYNKEGTEIGIEFLCSWCYVLFLAQPVLRVSRWQHLVVHCLMLLFGFILTNLYLTILSSMLTSGLFDPQPNSLEDLVDSPYRLLVDEFYFDYLNRSSLLPAPVISRMCIESNKALDKARTSLNESFMYFAYEDRMEALLYQQHLLKVPRFQLIRESIMYGLMSISISYGLPYLTLLNTYLRRIFECGILKKMINDAWRDTIDSGIYRLFRSEGTEHKPYDLQFYFYAFGMWAIGLIISTIIFSLELLRERMNLKRTVGSIPKLF